MITHAEARRKSKVPAEHQPLSVLQSWFPDGRCLFDNRERARLLFFWWLARNDETFRTQNAMLEEGGEL